MTDTHKPQAPAGTVGEDEQNLWRFRTAPVQLELDVPDLFFRLGLYALYEEAVIAANKAVWAAKVKVFDAVATPQERRECADGATTLSALDRIMLRIAKLLRRPCPRTAPTSNLDRIMLRMDKLRQTWAAVQQRAEQAGLRGEVVAAQQLADRIAELWEADKQAYRNAYESAAHQALAERDLGHLDVELVLPRCGIDIAKSDALSGLISDYARARTPLPMTGEAFHQDGDKKALLHALRAAGLTYADRANREGDASL